MKNSNHRGQWAGSSHLTERINELRAAHEEFLKVKDMFDDGWTIRSAKVLRPKRPRIQKAKTPKRVEVSIMGGAIRITVDFAEWQAHGSIGTITKKIF